MTKREIAERYHRCLPDNVREYLKDCRGIPPTLIDRQLLGWNGERLTIPVFGHTAGEVLGFRFATLPDDSNTPKITSDAAAKHELYGWETLARTPHRVVICEGELDRLVLEARGFPAVTCAAGTGRFSEEWAQFFAPIRHVFVCFNRTASSDNAAKGVQFVLPRARIAKLPAEVGENGTITDFFVGLGRTQLDFEVLLASAVTAVEDRPDQPPAVREFRPMHRSLQRRAERVRKRVPLHEIVHEFTRLQAVGRRLAGHCPFHDDGSRSFTVYPETNTYACSVCGAVGDIVMFLMNKESMTFGQALEALERFEFTHELYAS